MMRQLNSTNKYVDSLSFIDSFHLISFPCFLSFIWHKVIIDLLVHSSMIKDNAKQQEGLADGERADERKNGICWVSRKHALVILLKHLYLLFCFLDYFHSLIFLISLLFSSHYPIHLSAPLIDRMSLPLYSVSP